MELAGIRLVAFLVPLARESTQLVEARGPETYVRANPADDPLVVAELGTAGALAPAARLWLATAAAQEWPGTAGGTLELTFHTLGARSITTSFSDRPDAYVPLFHADLVDVPATTPITLSFEASTDPGSTVADVASALIPLSGFVATSARSGSAFPLGSSPLTVLTLNIPATTLPHERVTLGVVTVRRADAIAGVTEGRIVLDAEELARAENGVLGRYATSCLAGVDLAYDASAKTARIEGADSDPTPTGDLKRPVLIHLRYPEVSVAHGPEEAAP